MFATDVKAMQAQRTLTQEDVDAAVAARAGEDYAATERAWGVWLEETYDPDNSPVDRLEDREV
jgi:hypothetical protein